MKRKMTRVARGRKCGDRSASGPAGCVDKSADDAVAPYIGSAASAASATRQSHSRSATTSRDE